jgi:hypothetical protein
LNFVPFRAYPGVENHSRAWVDKQVTTGNCPITPSSLDHQRWFRLVRVEAKPSVRVTTVLQPRQGPKSEAGFAQISLRERLKTQKKRHFEFSWQGWASLVPSSQSRDML